MSVPPVPPVPQRCLIVVPSSGAFDSRSYRIASTLASRGHEVTIVARSAHGLAGDERHPAGYRIVRTDVSARDGLPRPIRWGLQWFTRARSREGRSAATGRAAPAATVQPSLAGVRPTGADRSPTARLRRGAGGLWRLLAIALTVRSQRGRVIRIAPAADLVHAMAYMGIPVGLAVGRRDRGRVIYDARDIYVDAANLARLPSPARTLFGRVERRWARQADRVVTVNRPYAEVMADRFGVVEPLIVLNCSYRQSAWTPRPRRFHDALGLTPEVRIVLYHGGLARDRGIEQLIAAVASMDPTVHLVLMGYGPLEADLRSRAEGADSRGRLHVLPAVAPTDLLAWVASADVAAMPIQPTTLNHRLTTPNKLFEAMAAGVPILASDLPGMAAIVTISGCGVLVDPTDPAAIATGLQAILDLPDKERRAMGDRGYAAHLETYNWESQADLLLAEYSRLTGRPW